MKESYKFQKLLEEAGKTEWSRWRPLLEHAAYLHELSIQPPWEGLPYPPEQIGPGYCYAPAFGHWDLIFSLLDSCPAVPEHTREQLINDLTLQQENGFLPGSIFRKNNSLRYSLNSGHPPIWPAAVELYCRTVGSDELKKQFLPNLIRQLRWFEKERGMENGGFFYLDVLTAEIWESGIDESVRCRIVPEHGRYACVDASSHVFFLYDRICTWLEELGEPAAEKFTEKRDALRRFIQTELYSEQSGFFHDHHLLEREELHYFGDGLWPVITGAASPEQAKRVILESLMNPERFFTPHPFPWIAVSDPLYELRMWRGPVWNSMTFLAAYGCFRYGFFREALAILDRALDWTERQYEETGAIWEFYHPFGGDQNDLQRKPNTKFNTPCREYLGHCPVFAMARLRDCAVKLEKVQ